MRKTYSKLETNFEKIRGKVVDAVGKLSNTELTYQKTAMCYNLCMLSTVHFACRIMSLREKEEKELQ